MTPDTEKETHVNSAREVLNSEINRIDELLRRGSQVCILLLCINVPCLLWLIFTVATSTDAMPARVVTLNVSVLAIWSIIWLTHFRSHRRNMANLRAIVSTNYHDV